MFDLILIIIMLGFFGVCFWLIHFFDILSRNN